MNIRWERDFDSLAKLGAGTRVGNLSEALRARASAFSRFKSDFPAHDWCTAGDGGQIKDVNHAGR